MQVKVYALGYVRIIHRVSKAELFPSFAVAFECTVQRLSQVLTNDLFRAHLKQEIMEPAKQSFYVKTRTDEKLKHLLHDPYWEVQPQEDFHVFEAENELHEFRVRNTSHEAFGNDDDLTMIRAEILRAFDRFRSRTIDLSVQGNRRQLQRYPELAKKFTEIYTYPDGEKVPDRVIAKFSREQQSEADELYHAVKSRGMTAFRNWLD